MASKSYVLKAKEGSSSASTPSAVYVTKATLPSSRYSASKPAARKTDFSTTTASNSSFSPSSVAPAVASSASSSPAPSEAFSSPAASPPSYPDDAMPGSGSASPTNIGGDRGQTSGDAFSNSPLIKDSVIGGLDDSMGQDWTRSFSGMAVEPFEKEVAEILMKPLHADDIEITPDGLLYLPEIKYRRILNQAFGPGGWGLAPRTPHSVSPKTISREYALICRGRFVSTARGEQDYFDPNNLATASEGCKSNALMRCCKDLGIASELWDPSFVRKFKKQYCDDAFAEHVVTKRKKKLWKRKEQADFEYPYAKCK
ncbi:hypothetical protein BGW38_003206 [Lunasporangiospora selenospora]|uniref:Mitochondrial genome maintenance protein MGM101 n=1 Tax=Lunasporangiospora selenospora TaxID=979761 RepID=A0A9P6G5E1_9FUNG|nr:hypothetical protein BGW38_003206 [Lunasporangiospora selenospora]